MATGTGRDEQPDDRAKDGTLRIAPARGLPGLVITGDVDESAYWVLVGALAGFAERTGEIQVDLAGTGYCALAGLRAILGLARPSSGGHALGRHLVLYAPPHLTEVLRILGWDAMPGLKLVERESGSPPGRWA